MYKGANCTSDTFISYARETRYYIGAAQTTGTTAPGDGEDFTSDEAILYNGFDMPSTCDTGTWSGGDCVDSEFGFNRIYIDSSWDFLTTSNEAAFANTEVFTYDSGVNAITSSGPSTGWTWPAGDNSHEFYLINNTIVHECDSGFDQYVVRAHPDTSVLQAKNNIVVDLNSGELNWDASSSTDELAITQSDNYWTTSDPGFTSISTFDYSLQSSAISAINQGATLTPVNGMSLLPKYQYSHTASKTDRDTVQTIDIGAYEYSSVILNTVDGVSF
jgi:hypothetical protein